MRLRVCLRLCGRWKIMGFLGKKKGIERGVYHFRGTDDLEGKRIHLRVDGPDKGVLIMDASRIMVLNETGLNMAYHLLSGSPDREIVKKLRSMYRVKKRKLEEDLKEFKREMFSLLRTEDVVSVMEDDLEVLYKGQMAPYRMDLAVTYRCNNACVHCYNEDKEIREMGAEDWKKVLDILWKVGIPHVVFTGGEPTLRDDLPELIGFAEGIGQITGLNTNGRKLSDNKYMRSLTASGLDHVQITLESHRKKVHDSITKVDGSYDETLEGIRNAVESGIYVVSNTTMMRENKDDLLDTIEFLRDHEVRHIAVNSLIRSGKGKNANALGYEEISEVLELAREQAAMRDFELRWYTPTPYCRLNPMALGLGIKHCTACKMNMAVEPDGTVIPCQSYYEGLGNILEDPWESIWEHELCGRIREGRFAPDECKECDLFGVCGGGCPLSWKAGDYICMGMINS